MDSTPAGATRMGNRSSTRHGGPAQVFMGPVRKWRKVLSPVSTTSPSPSAARTALLKWTPVPPATNGGVKEDSPMTDEMLARQVRPVKYVPISAVLQRSREEAAVEEAENAEAEAADAVEPVEAAERTEATEKTEAAEPMDVADADVGTRVAEAIEKADEAEATGATGLAEAAGAKESTEALASSEISKANEAHEKEGQHMAKQSDPSSVDARLISTS